MKLNKVLWGLALLFAVVEASHKPKKPPTGTTGGSPTAGNSGNSGTAGASGATNSGTNTVNENCQGGHCNYDGATTVGPQQNPNGGSSTSGSPNSNGNAGASPQEKAVKKASGKGGASSGSIKAMKPAKGGKGKGAVSARWLTRRNPSYGSMDSDTLLPRLAGPDAFADPFAYPDALAFANAYADPDAYASTDLDVWDSVSFGTRSAPPPSSQPPPSLPAMGSPDLLSFATLVTTNPAAKSAFAADINSNQQLYTYISHLDPSLPPQGSVKEANILKIIDMLSSDQAAQKEVLDAVQQDQTLMQLLTQYGNGFGHGVQARGVSDWDDLNDLVTGLRRRNEIIAVMDVEKRWAEELLVEREEVGSGYWDMY
ncbi:hypothetical protein MMC10_004338 [Thelotrema lepadinum]|nr:hypothetical protein [Thelotrema lepadinum]